MPTKSTKKPEAAPQVEPEVQSEIAEETVALEVIPKNSAAVSTLQDVQNLMLADAEEDLGFEKGDIALPFLRILQSNSPQVKAKNPKHVDGAHDGHFFNSATNQTYDGDAGLDVIPVHFTRQATLWLPRGENDGGGFVREVPMPEALELLKTCTKNDKNKDITPDGQELLIAAMYYLLIIDKAKGEFLSSVAFPLASTQMKKSRSWNAIIMNARLPHPSGTGSYRAPMHGFVYHLTTIPEQNAKGEWMGLKIQQDVPLLKYVDGQPKESFPGAANLYLMARDFRALVAQGKVKVKQDEEQYDDLGGGEGEGADGKGKDDDDLPF